MPRIACFAAVGIFALAFALPVKAQSPSTQPTASAPTTKLEGFTPASGTLLLKGYDTIGTAAYGVSVDAQERKDARGAVVRGLVVEVKEIGGTTRLEREGRSFVDADEIPELLKGLDALLAIKVNPTQYKNFEAEYTTRGELMLIAFNNSKGEISYALRAGRSLPATRYLKVEEMQKVRGLIEAAMQKLSAVAASK
jgi:hypothetical protein